MGNIRVNGTKGIRETEFAVIPTIRIYYPLYIKRGALELMLSHQVGHVSIRQRLSQINFLI